MTEAFFKYRIFFETSFLLPQTVSQDKLQDAVNQAIKTRFEVFLAKIDEENKKGYLGEEKRELLLELIQGSTIQEIHKSIIEKCAEDHENAFRIFWAEDEKKDRYFVIHSHHGVADGFLINSFVQCVYHVLFAKDEEKVVFQLTDPCNPSDAICFPPSWNQASPQENVAEWRTALPQPTVYPKVQADAERRIINTERIVDVPTSQRAVTAARCYRSYCEGNSCIHGMLLQCLLRAVHQSENLEESGVMTINTIVNMRRYLKPTGRSYSDL